MYLFIFVSISIYLLAAPSDTGILDFMNTTILRNANFLRLTALLIHVVYKRNIAESNLKKGLKKPKSLIQ